MLSSFLVYIETPVFLPPKKTVLEVACVVTYANGATETFTSKTPLTTLTIFNMATGTDVSTINTNLDLTPTFTGTIQSYTVSGTFNVQIISDTSGGGYTYGEVLYNSGSRAMSPISPLPTLTSGSSSIISSSTVTASGLQSLYNGWVNGLVYSLQDTFTNIDVTITFTDGIQLSQTATSGSITFQFEYLS